MNTKKSEAAKINSFALLWWTVTVAIISVAYLLEVLKGERTIVYYVVLILFGVVPLLLGYWRYRVDPDTTQMKLFMAYGYTLLYTFVLLTGDTVLTFVFIFPILSTLVAYRDYKLLIKYAILNMIVNVVSVVIKIVVFQMTDADNIADYEIQVLQLCLFSLLLFLHVSLHTLLTRKKWSLSNLKRSIVSTF